MQLFDLHASHLTFFSQAHDTHIRALKWSHNGDWMLSGDSDGFVKYWQPNLNPVKTLHAHPIDKQSCIRDIAFAPTDLKFVTAADDTLCKIWDFDRPDVFHALKGHAWEVRTCDWHPNKGLIASGSRDNHVKLWDPRGDGRCLTTLNGQVPVNVARFEPQRGNGLAVANKSNVVKIYDLRMMRDVLLLKGNESNIMSLCWHPIHANFLTTGNYDGAMYHYLLDEPNPPEGSEVSATNIPVCDSPTPETAPSQSIYPAHRVNHAHDFTIWSMEWHPLGHILASGSNDRVTRFWTRPRPGDTECFKDRYHLGEAGAEALGTWSKRNNRRQQQLDDEDQDEDGEDAIVDQNMPAARQLNAAQPNGGLPGVGFSLPGLSTSTNGDNILSHLSSRDPSLHFPPPPPPPPQLSSMPLPGHMPPPPPNPNMMIPGLPPPPGSLDALPPEMRQHFLDALRRQGHSGDGGVPPPPMPMSGVGAGGGFDPAGLPGMLPPPPPPPHMFANGGSSGGGGYPNGAYPPNMPNLPGFTMPPPGSAPGANDIDPNADPRKRRTPLPSQSEMLAQWRRH